MDFKIDGGNSRLIDALADRIGRANIKLSRRVTSIEQEVAGSAKGNGKLNKKGKVTVTAGNESYVGDACICTVPSRVLNAIRFEPELPPAQRAAADQLQYSRIVKTPTLFSERFWKQEDFSLVTDATSHYYFHSTKSQAGRQGILTSYTIGDKADVLAAQDDQRKKELIALDLAPLDPDVAGMIRGIASYAWQRDRFTEGAYALYRPGEWFSLRPLLQRPHHNVLFAGEHLAEWQGFMEGAVVTGEEAAEALGD
jgi:monoamine oxidase